MKIETKVSGITHDELVNLLSTATEGSCWLSIKKRKSDYYGTPLESESDCREDTWAKVLLAGKSVIVEDYYAEGEVYGTLPHKVKGDVTRYELSLKDIEDGVARAIDNGSYIRKYINDWIEDDGCQLDLHEAEAIMQYIVFGEEVYG